MGYTHGTKWTNEKIEIEIRKIINILSIERMPSRSEIESVIGDSALTNKIAKSGGFDYWAKKLGLAIKDSETSLGKKYERITKEMLKVKGFKVEKMTTKHPYDLLVNDYIKIDVKVANLYTDEKVGSFHTFNLEKLNPTCDIYIAITLIDGDIDRILIIPSKYLKITQLSIGKDSKYNKYIDRWDYINKYDRFYKEVI